VSADSKSSTSAELTGVVNGALLSRTGEVGSDELDECAERGGDEITATPTALSCNTVDGAR